MLKSNNKFGKLNYSKEKEKMKKIFLLIMIFTFTTVFGFVQSEAETSIQNGNSLYQKGDYDGAVKSYESVLKLGFESASLYYNIGNSYFRLNNLGKSILNYEKALKLEPGDEDVIYNLRIAQARTIDQIQSVPKIFLVEWWEEAVTSFSLSGWGALMISFYLIMIVSVGFYSFTRSGKIQRLAFYFGSINLSFLVLILILFISRYNREATANFGVLLAETTTAKQSPNDQSSDAFVIHEGVKFEIEESFNNWAKIKLADGKVGWLTESSFEGI